MPKADGASQPSSAPAAGFTAVKDEQLDASPQEAPKPHKKRSSKKKKAKKSPRRRGVVRRSLGALGRAIRRIRPSMVIAIATASFTAYWIWGGEFTINEAFSALAITEEGDTAAEETTTVQTVRYLVAKEQDLPISAVLTGRTRASRVITVRSEASGTVIIANGDRGARIQEGEVVLALDKGIIEFELRQAEEELALRTTEYEDAVRLNRRSIVTKLEVQQRLVAQRAAITNLESIRERNADTIIYAPFTAFVQEKLVERGDVVSPGSGVITLVDLRPLTVAVYVSEQRIGKLRLGQLATVTVEDRVFRGRVATIAPDADPQTRTYEVEISLPNNNWELRAGRTVEVELVLSTQRAVFIPQSLLTLNNENKLGVKLINNGNIVSFAPVTIIRDERNGTWVSGIPSGTRIVSIGHQLVEAGDKTDPYPDTLDRFAPAE